MGWISVADRLPETPVIEVIATEEAVKDGKGV